MSEKKMKFRELAEKRVNNALKNIQLIGNLSNTRAYDYDDEDVKKMFKILKEEIGTKNTCRISLYFYNTKEEIDKLVNVLKNENIINEII